MRILWWSNSPKDPTGYGVETALFVPMLRDLGHEVAIGAFTTQGAPGEWQGVPVYPGGRAEFGLDMLAGHYGHWRADVCITLMDTWKLEPEALDEGMRVACWTPVDCAPLGRGDRDAIEKCDATPIAVSRHGERMMRDADLDPLYVPHGVDTMVFQPPPDRDELRRSLGIHDRFVIGINGANQTTNRKGFAEQFRAFATFARKHPDAVLLVHSTEDNLVFGGLDLDRLARACDIRERVGFTNQYGYLAGMTSQESLAAWYGALDLLSCCSLGEGFGIPLIEAQACGTPVVATSWSAMSELRGPGWLAGGEPEWHWAHEAWWCKPHISAIALCYDKAYQHADSRREQAREFALAYDAKTVLQKYWVPALDRIASTLP